MLPTVPFLAPFDEFRSPPSRPTRQSAGTDLLPGLPDKAPRAKKSPLPKDPKTKEGTLEVPGLSSLLDSIDKAADERHQSNHAGVPPIKERRELPSEENKNKSIESSSNQTGDKGLDAVDPSLEGSSNQTGDKGLDAIDPSTGSSSSQEGIRSLEDKEAEAWLANTKSMFDERTNGPKKWGDDVSDDEDKDKSDKGSNVTKDNKGRDSDGSITDEIDVHPKDANDNPGSIPLSTNPPADGRDTRRFTFEFIKDGNESLKKDTVGQEAIKSPNRTQIQESSSAAGPHVNCGAGTDEDKANWIAFLSGPKSKKPDTPNREVVSRSPAYDPLPLDDSDQSDGDEETKDQDSPKH